VNTDWLGLVLGAVQGIAVIAVFILVVIIALTLLLDLKKLRRVGRAGARSLEELVGQERFGRFLPPSAPRGPIDQLRTPELLEAAERKSR
jgi:hypothetical protein